MELQDRVLAIVERSRGGLTVEAVAQAYAKEMEQEIRETLERLSGEGRLTKNRGASISATTYHRAIAARRSLTSSE